MNHILVVEDDLSISHLITYNLAQAGHRVVTAFDGPEALHSVDSACPKLVTLDLLLPRQSGWEVLLAIRTHPRRQIATLPIIVLSALSSSHLRTDLRKSGVDHCLGKPFSVMELCVLVRSLLANRADAVWDNPL
ncbi:MAG: response regulator transcription factor [Deltaproteobacteria bacterium]|nr:response regulator transcription factor [Deltaproteobacteria bacterium]